MSEGLSAAVDYLFRMERLHRIETNIIPGNLPSQRVVEKLGFLYEGRARKYLFINGNWRDHLHMVLLNEDGENQEPA
jgi:ribosomal-protein-alanine N-acetyltransferase